MKLAVTSPWAISESTVGGTERFVVDLAESLVGLGHTVDVYMFSGISHKEHGINFIALDLFGKGGIIDEFQLKKNFGDFSEQETYGKLARKIELSIDADFYDAFHINTQLLLKAWPNKRRIFTVHTNPFEFKQAWGDAAYETMLTIARNEAVKNKTTFTAPSEYYSSFFATAIGTKVIPIPHAIDTKRLVANHSRDELMKQYGLNSKKTHILLPSRLEPVQKQPSLLFDALQRLPQNQLAQINIVVSGVDEQYEGFATALSDQAKKAGCAARFIRFDHMADAYTAADIVVLPSQSESFGYSALESLSLGIPSLMNDIPTFREIADGNSAAVFFSNSSDDLADKLSEMLEKGAPRTRAGARWKQRYELAKWAKKYEVIL